VRKVCFPEGSGSFDCKTNKPRRHKAFEDGVAHEATKILKQNVTQGTGTAAQIGCPAAGKTGTTDDFTDAWFVGYTPRLATSVWVGHATDRRTLGEGSAGGTVAAPIWGAYMKTAKGAFCGDFPDPRQPFKAVPFFGKYATTGVKGNEAAGDYRVDPGAGTDLETGRGNDGQDKRYPSDQYEAPPQDAPGTVQPAPQPSPQPEPAPAPAPAPPAGGTAPGGTAGGTAPPP
jgi:penicillin-binding protein 1A